MKINFVGAYFGTTGYAVHLRNLALATARMNPETSVETQFAQDWNKMVNEEENVLLKKNPYIEGMQVLITNPLMSRYKLPEKNNSVIPFMVFEGDKAPMQWGLLGKDERIKIVLTPSLHSKNALVQAGVPENKIKILPHGYNPEIMNENAEKKHKSDKCSFAWVKGWNKGINDRSGFQFMLRAFAEEFKQEENVRLIAHINPAYNGPGWDLNQEISKLNIKEMIMDHSRPVNREIMISHKLRTEKQLAELYCSADFFVCSSMSDAFNIPALEAQACGLPLILTNFGGQTDYAHPSSWKVGGIMVPAPIMTFEELPLYEQTKWLSPSIEELRKALREAYTLWNTDKKRYGELRQEALKASIGWTWKDTAVKLLSILKEEEKR